jgi:hypothetical protein
LKVKTSELRESNQSRKCCESTSFPGLTPPCRDSWAHSSQPMLLFRAGTAHPMGWWGRTRAWAAQPSWLPLVQVCCRRSSC